jgi:hypothetical protein
LQSLDTDQRGAGFLRKVGSAVDIGAFEIQTPVAPPLPEDYSHNNILDAADYIVWRNSYGTTVPEYTAGDGTGDGTVDGNDYAAWQAKFGTSLQAAAGMFDKIIQVKHGSKLDSLRITSPKCAINFDAPPSHANLLELGDFREGQKLGRGNLQFARADSNSSEGTSTNADATLALDKVFADWRSNLY